MRTSIITNTVARRAFNSIAARLGYVPSSEINELNSLLEQLRKENGRLVATIKAVAEENSTYAEIFARRAEEELASPSVHTVVSKDGKSLVKRPVSSFIRHLKSGKECFVEGFERGCWMNNKNVSSSKKVSKKWTGPDVEPKKDSKGLYLKPNGKPYADSSQKDLRKKFEGKKVA